ncbi:GLUG motif-containing protein [Tannockella kyphosi]|uniref:GLUG motif-containing protein n=1 Tax=Tannockella kyphosi TaxID=2899121 RepID=UPI002013719F|nr:GLUG motif-containing protein [Tannockella kyphosi]
MKKILGFAAFIVIMLIFVLNNTTTISSYVEEDGFVMPESKIDEYMIDITYNDADDFDLVEIDEFDYIYEKSSSYYTEEGTQIDLSYPAIIRDGNAIKFINGGAYLISDEFEFAATVDGTTIASQTCFNMDGGVVDDNTYILAQLRNGLFVATTDFVIETQLEEFTISKNAIVYFDDEFINVYNYEDGSYEFLAIRGLQNATITYDDVTYQYSDFYDDLYQVVELVKQEIEEEEILEKIEELKDIAEEPLDTALKEAEEVDAPEDPPEIEVVIKEESEEEEEVTTETVEPQEIPYVKPEVTIENLSTWVYTVNGDIEIDDPASRIDGSVTFYVYNESGTLVLRDQTKKSGIFSLSSLNPDTTFYIEAYFTYYNEYNIKVTEQCLDLTAITTLPFEGNISDVYLTFEEDSILYSRSMGVVDFTMENTTDYDPDDDSLENFYKDVLPYVYTMNFIFEDQETGEIITSKVSNSTISNLRSGSVLDYVTSSDLEPNSTYSYYVVAYDRYGNEFTLVPENDGEYTTCKEAPSVDISVSSRSTEEVVLELSLNDDYEAMTSDVYTVVIMYAGEVVELEYTLDDFTSSGSEVEVSASNTGKVYLTITNLPYSSTVSAYAYGSYNLEDNQGDQEDMLIGELSFYTASIPVGSITYNNEFINIGGTTATVTMSLSQNSSSSLITLLTDFTMYFETDGQSLSYTYTDDMFNSVNIEQNYDEELGALVIVEGDESESTPRVLLYASKEALETNGVWQTFLNSGLYGSNDVNAGTISVELLQGTLLAASVYEYEMTSMADLGSNAFSVTTSVTDDEFETLKQEPTIYYEDYFIAGSILEIYNLEVTDIHDVITDGVYSAQLYEDGALVNTITLNVSTVEDIRFDCLSEGHVYTLAFVAEEYNLTFDDDLLQSQVVIKEFSFSYEEGLIAAIELYNVSYNYDTINTSGDYGYVASSVDIQENAGYNVSTNEVEEEGWDEYFTTDYLEYNCNSSYYSTFVNFGDYAEVIYIAFYSYDDSTGVYTLVGELSSTVQRTGMVSISNYISSSQFNYKTATHIRVTGFMDNLEEAYYYQYTEENVDTILDISVDSSDFVLDVQVGAASADYTSATYSSTGYLEVTASEFLEIKSSVTYRLYFYDENYNYLATENTFYSGSHGTAQVPSGAAYVRVMLDTTSLGGTSVFRMGRLSQTDTLYGEDSISTQATLHWTLEDTRDDAFFLLNEYNSDTTYTITKYEAEIVTGQTYETSDISYEHIETLEYDGTGNIDVDIFSTETVNSNKAYKYEISIEYHGRTVVLDSVTFETDNTIKFIDSINDFEEIEMDRYATYYVVNDIREDEGTTTNYIYFGGILDFQGYSITLTRSGTTNEALFQDLYIGGEIRNVEIIIEDGDVCRTFLNTNYGTLSNIKYTINKSIDSPVLSNLIDNNTQNGVIDNFIIEFNGDTFFYNEEDGENSAVFVRYNNGTISNGYIYNTDEDASVYLHDNAGVLTYYTTTNSVVENVYAICDISSNYDQASDETWYSGVISVDGEGRFTNIFAVSTRYEFYYDPSGVIIDMGFTNEEDPLFSSLSGSIHFDDSFENVYLLSEYQTYEVMYSEYIEVENLYDSEWYDIAFNEDNNFIVDEMVSQGFYPILDLDSSMYDKQVYIELPELDTVIRPEYLYSTITLETLEYTTMEFVFYNPSNTYISSVSVDGLNASVTTQALRDDFYIVTVKLSMDTTDPNYIDEYTLENFVYSSGSLSVEVSVNQALDVSFYYSIDEISDFVEMENHTTWNFRLTSDIDFADFDGNWTNEVYVSNTFYGTFDGGIYNAYGELTSNNYTIKNIDLTSSQFSGSALLFYKLQYATISNINFENLSWDKESGNDTGIIFYSYYSTLDNIHFDTVDFVSNYDGCTLARQVWGCTITNCSASNVTLTNGSLDSPYTAGGLIANTNYSIISNCYVQDFYISTHDLDLTQTMAIGGIVGNASGGSIENCYAVGRIENPSYNGGIIGLGAPIITNCWTDVLIVASGDFNGGISGSSSAAYVTDCLALGSIVIMQEEPTYTHRIAAIDNWYYADNNYGYEGQTINSNDPGADYTDGILTYEELQVESTYVNTIVMGSEFDYSEVSDALLPKLYDTNGELLDNQVDNYVNNGSINMQITDAEYNNQYYVSTIRIEHEGYYIDEEIYPVIIDGMAEANVTYTTNSSGTATVVYIESTKESAFDLYLITATLISNTDSSDLVELVSVVDYGITVYWTIGSTDEWYNIMSDHGYTNENIQITSSIDFAEYYEEGYDVLDGLSLNRLDGLLSYDGSSLAELKNIQLDDTTDDNLVSTIYASFSNITISSSTINSTSTSAQSNIGFIGVVQGTSDNLVFTENSIYVENANSTNAGMISSAYGLISNVTVDTVTIKMHTYSDIYRSVYTGAVVGYTTSGIQNVTASNVTVEVENGYRIGGIVGYINKVDTSLVDLSSISVDNVTVTGAAYVGGVVGSSNNISNLSISATNVKVNGMYHTDGLSEDLEALGYRIGGVAGYTSTTISNDDLTGYSIDGISVTGQYQVGGVVGHGTVRDADVRDITVSGVRMVGGIGGYVSGETYYLNVYDVDVTASESYAGGIGGRTYQMFYTYVFDSDVQAAQYAGGLSGFIGNYTYSNDSISQAYGAVYYSAVLDTNITATSGSHAGGLASYIYSYGSSIYRSFVSDSIIYAEQGYAGGLAGEITTETVQYSYVTGGSVTSNSGDYTGGLIGLVDHFYLNDNENYNGQFYRSYSDTTVSGNDYVGGIFGYYRTDYTSPTTTYRYLFSLVNYSDVSGNDNVYGVGYVEDDVTENGYSSLDCIYPTHYGTIVSYDEVLINGSTITESQVSNVTEEEFSLVSFEEVSSYSFVNSGVSTGLNYSTSYFLSYLPNTGSLGSFDIILTKDTDSNYVLEFNNINLTGDYTFVITNGSTTITETLNVANNSASYTWGTSVSNDFTVTIKDSTGTTLTSEFFNSDSNTSYSYVDILVDGVASNYKSSTSNEEITLTVNDDDDDGTGTYTWYRLYDGQGYSESTKVDVTSFAAGNSLTTDIPGIYFAINTAENPDVRTEMFVYETYLYTPMISSSTTSLYPYQSGYTYSQTTGISNTYSGNLVFNGTALAMISRDSTDNYTPISINIAATNSLFSMLMLNVVDLPDYTVYASGIDSINIEFDDSVAYEDDTNNYQIKVSSGGDTVTYDVTGRVMTLSYDFGDDITITLMNGNEEATTNYEVEDLQSLISTYGNNFYYLSVEGVTDSSGETIVGDLVHIFDDYALDSEGNVYDLSTQTIIETIDNNLILKDSVALYESEYEGNKLYTYSTFTYNQTEALVIDEVIFVKNGNVYGFDGDANKTSVNLIADNYNDEVYKVYVNGNGSLIDLNDTLHIPEGIDLTGIVEITDSFDQSANVHVMLIRYETGEVIAFDYSTGEEIELSESTSISLIGYAWNLITGVFSSDDSDDVDYGASYEDSQNMEDAIEDASQSDIDAIQSDSTSGTSGSSSGGTVSIYNEEVLSFETYFIAELISTASEEVTSVQEKIEVASEAGYQGTLNNLVVTTSYVSEAKDNTVNIVIFAVLSVSVGGLLVYLKKSNKEKDIL